MWNDEDNNPYGTSFDGHEPGIPNSPAENQSSFAQQFYQQDEESESDEDYSNQLGKSSSPKSYESRILQILHENPELPIQIVDAGKSLESGGKYIVYTIRTGDLEVRRRYSEFNSLRDALCRLHPTLIIPPIPEKHTMADYAANPTKAKQDQQIIDLRKRMLTVFLNRCRRMKQVFNDGVWWRFLDPNASWSEVLHSHPISSIPKSIMKAPPLDPANPTPAHAFLPVPASSAKLKPSSRAASANPTGVYEPPENLSTQSPTSRRGSTIPAGMQEADLEAHLANFETKIEKLEGILTGPMEKVNRRTLQHLNQLSSDLAELGARFNGFSLSEQSPSLAAAIERVGQAVDSSYIAGEELSSSLAASFAEPMRESAQFAGVVRGVLRYRVLKRVQQETTADELAKKRALLASLETSEQEAKRIENYLSSTGAGSTPRRSNSSARESSSQRHRRESSQEDTASIDSDFPPTRDVPSATQGVPEIEPSLSHRKSASGNFITNKIFGSFRHAVNGVVDVDPERTRRDLMGKTRESIQHLEQAQQASEQDVRDANNGVYADLLRFQAEKEDDLKRYMLAYARAQIEWAKKNRETWMEAKAEISKIEAD